jgi:hypothetical protein
VSLPAYPLALAFTGALQAHRGDKKIKQRGKAVKLIKDAKLV